MKIRICFLLLVLCVSSIGFAQSREEPTTLVPGQPVERELAGGESHTYQLILTTGKFVRFRLDQRAIDAALILSAPDGKKLIEMNLSGAGEEESLSLEAAAAGSYRLTVRGIGPPTLHGSSRLQVAVQATATALDRKRLSAEALLSEATELRKQAGKTAPQAIEKLQQALPLWRELGETRWTGYSLMQIGSAFYDLSQFVKAAEYLEQALAIYREAKDRRGEGNALNSLGTANRVLGRTEKALEYYDQALVIAREVKNRTGEGNVLNNLAIVYRDLGRTEKALENAEQALAIAREIRNRLVEGNTLYSMASIYYGQSRYEKAIQFYEQALVIYREVKNRTNEGLALNSLGISYKDLGRTEKAVEYYQQALAISREIKNRLSEANTLNNLGRAEAGLGHTEKAIECLEQAVAIYGEVKNRIGEGNTLNNLGIVYRDLGRTEKAIEYYEQGLQIVREVKNRSIEGDSLILLGRAHSILGGNEKAIEYYEQALTIYREVKNRFGEGNSLNSLGSVYRDLGNRDKALEYYQQALAIYREVKQRAGEGDALDNLGIINRESGGNESALVYHEQALLIARELKAPAREAFTLKQLAKDEESRGNLDRAHTLIEESLGIVESLRADVIGEQSRAGLLATAQSSYQFYTDLLMRQHRAEPTKGFDTLAVETSERQRARSLLDLLTEARTDVTQGVDGTLLERKRNLGRQLNDKAQQLAQAARGENAAALKQELSQLETDYERAQAAIRKSTPHYAALTDPQPLKLTEIQAQLDADTLLLEYAVGEDRSYLWAITKDSLTSYELPKEELIRKSALAVYELLTARSTNRRGETVPARQARIAQAEARLPVAAQSLSETLLAPVAAQLGKKRLVIVADGALQYIPFAMLPEPSVVSGQLSLAKSNEPQTTDHGRPLIVDHEVISLPSASVLAIQRRELAGRQPAPKMLAVIADPVFDVSDARFTAPVSETPDNAPTRTIGFDDARSIEHLAENSDNSGVTTLKLVIPRLPFTRQEASQLLALAPKGSSLGAIDFKASRDTVLSPELSQYRYVHFATHGMLDSERPGLSSLVLSMIDAQGQPQNGFLRANDIYNLKLPAELVVLSACQTGLGKEIKGEGLVGLTRGFMYAGAARVVVSLWNVNDKATAALMTKFYEKMLKQGERPAAALRAAQVEMWKQKQWHSPYYWAPFTMQGEWR